MAKRSVLLVSHTANMFGGSERSLVEIARYLKNDSDFLVTVVLPRDGSLKKVLADYSITTKIVPYEWAAFSPESSRSAAVSHGLMSLPGIFEFLEKEKPDVIMTNTSVIPWFACAASELGIPHFWFIRELFGDNDYAQLPVSLPQYLEVAPASRYFTNSQTMKALLAEHVDNDISVVLPTISDHALFHTARNYRLLDPQAPKLCIIGSINQTKNQLEALKAMKILKDEGLTPTLTLIGASEPKYMETLQKYIRRHNLSENVVFKKYDEDPFPAMQRHDLCLLTSTFEAFGRVLVESMLLGVVVIAANNGGGKEITQDGTYGYVYTARSPESLAKKIRAATVSSEKLAAKAAEAKDYAVKQFLENPQLEILANALREPLPKTSSLTQTWIDKELRSEHTQLRRELTNANAKISAQAATIAHLNKHMKRMERYPEWRVAIFPRKLLLKLLRKFGIR